MPIITEPMGTLLIALAALAALLIWFARDRKYPGPRLHGDSGIDHEELEAAERDGTSSFDSVFATWRWTVCSLIESRLAMA